MTLVNTDISVSCWVTGFKTYVEKKGYQFPVKDKDRFYTHFINYLQDDVDGIGKMETEVGIDYLSLTDNPDFMMPLLSVPTFQDSMNKYDEQFGKCIKISDSKRAIDGVDRSNFSSLSLDVCAKDC